MTLRSSGPRAASLAALVAATALSLVAPLTPAAQAAALAAPGGLAVANKNSSTPILSWTKVKKAAGYQVQVDNDASFASPEFAVSTVNFRAVPTAALRPGQNYWRVRSVAGEATSSWSQGGFDVSPVGVPVPTSPGNGASLIQPDNPPLLRWDGAQGAMSYTVQLDGDSDFIDAKSYTTKITSLVVPDPLIVGTYFWRVIAAKTTGIVSQPSATSSFSVQPLASPTQTYPPNSVDFKVQEVVLDWAPVTGAKSYDVQVARDQAFTQIEDNATGILGTRYSRAVSLDNREYWWRVRAIDLLGQATPWTTSQNLFRRNYPEEITPLYPLGTDLSPATVASDDPYLSWTPVKRAALYEITMADDENLSTDVRTCTTALTSYTTFPGGSGVCRLDAGKNWWSVRALDYASTSSRVLGAPTPAQAFAWSAPVVDAVPDPAPGFAQVSGTAIGISSYRIDQDGGCTATLCGDVPATPVFDWDEQQYAKYYRVLVSEDANFTNIAQNVVTNETRLALTAPLFESSAGGSYYWYVIPCRGGTLASPTTCGQSPQFVPGLQVKQFRKVSPPVVGLSSSDPAGTDITFSWQDYFTTNQATAWAGQGETGNQSARTYRIEVDTEPSFQAPLLDTAVVDQTTYTAPAELYPEGTLYWRVQALDSGQIGLPWSGTAQLTKSSPAVAPTSPGNGAVVSGTVPFTWAPQAFASSYTIEVFKNNDAAFSLPNRVFTATVKTAAYAWSQALPASDTPYTWRVRRTDAFNNVGPWSETMRLTSLGSAPQLLGPGNGTWQKSAGPLFEWTEVAGAASYVLEVRSNASASVTSVPTTATAHAPVTALATAAYTWRVIAKDAAGQVLGTSPNRSFRVDATPPTVLKITPLDRILHKKTIIKVFFSEKVRGVSKKTVKLFWLKGAALKKVKVKVKVTTFKKGKAAKVDPKSVRPGATYLLVLSTKIKDKRGNRLVAAPAQTSAQTSARLLFRG